MSKRKEDPNWNPRLRNQGNPHARVDTRPAIGRNNVMPMQGILVPSPKFVGARYRLGTAARPTSIVFDNGFLDKFPPRKPTAADYVALTKWKAILSGAESLRPDWQDACQAYRHFLEGMGLPRAFPYESYIMNDKSGETTLANAMLDIQDGAEVIWDDERADL